jgi:hypothetical protein
MTTTAIAIQPARPPRTAQYVLISCVVSGLMGVLVGIGATALVTNEPTAPAATPAAVESNTGLLPTSADAAERLLTRDVAVRSVPAGADAAERWLVLEVEDLPTTPDAAERWLTTP